jgi:Mrp family chromosome partitioning ATPase/DUF971 family protein
MCGTSDEDRKISYFVSMLWLNAFARRGVVVPGIRESLRRFSSSSIVSEDVLRHLSKIIDPDLNRDIVSLNFVKNLSIIGSRVSFDLELTTPACPVKDQFVALSERILKDNIPAITDVSVRLTAQPKSSPKTGNGLKRVHNIIAVSSCKGGVGKSSISVNLSYMLAQLNPGLRVGLLDADIFGPSLPTLIPSVEPGPFDETMAEQVRVFQHNNVKLMSIGYLKPGESISLRGPMVSSLIQQLLTMTGWGELDYLVIDMPPGTGDIQLTVAQHAKIDGSVIVTTPQSLALVDVLKGVELWNKMAIPSLCVVENMQHFLCTTCNTKHHIFAASPAAEMIAQRFGIEHTIGFPLDPAVAASSAPFVVQAPRESPSLGAFRELAETVVRECAKVKFADTEFVSLAANKGTMGFEERRKKEVVWRGETTARKLRLACKSAVMVDEWTGKPLFKEEDIPKDVHPVKTEMAGRYALRVDWSDGHHSIYPLKAIKALCGER